MCDAVRVDAFARNSAAEAAWAELIEFELTGPAPVEAFFAKVTLSVAHRELDKTLLFFLEADRATEPLTSARRGRGLAGKIAAYQAYLQVGQHARYEEILKTSLRGFRMLLLVEGSSRWVSACRLVRESPPSEFIWLTRRDLLLQVGCWGPIWAAGGRITEPHQSILGTKMPQPCPTPSEVGRKNARTK
jgi:hypothetical protein